MNHYRTIVRMKTLVRHARGGRHLSMEARRVLRMTKSL